MRKAILPDVPLKQIQMLKELMSAPAVFAAWNNILRLPRPASTDDSKSIWNLAKAWREYFDARDEWLKLKGLFEKRPTH